jgi:hypothetical protein
MKRSTVAALLVLSGSVAGWAETLGRQQDDVLALIPEPLRSDYLEQQQVERELQMLRPLFPHFGVAILQEVRELEQRPEGRAAAWAGPLSRWYRSRPLLSEFRPEKAARMVTITIEPSNRSRTEPRLTERQPRMSDDEREVRSGGLTRRLINLAITGRITKDEYDGLVKRLQGN